MYKRKGPVPDRIASWNCWNENIGGRIALDLLYRKMSLWPSFPFMGARSQIRATCYYETNPQGHKQ